MMICAPAAIARVNVVELVNFYCPSSYEAESLLAPLVTRLSEQDGVLDVVPLFTDDKTSWPSRVYLGVAKAQQASAKAALFNAAIVQGLPMSSANASCEVLQRALNGFSLQACVQQSQSTVVSERLFAALQLVKHLAPTQANLLFPVFVVERDDQIQAVLSRAQYPVIAALIQAVMEKVNALS